MTTNSTYIVRAKDYHVFEIDESGTKIRSRIGRNSYEIFAIASNAEFALDDFLKNGHFIIEKKEVKHYKKLNSLWNIIMKKYKKRGLDYLSDGEREFIGF
jgi:hypothetical protein